MRKNLPPMLEELIELRNYAKHCAFEREIAETVHVKLGLRHATPVPQYDWEDRE